jgi:hypothetical protein
MWCGFGAATVPSKRRDRPLLRLHASVKISQMPDYLRDSWAVGYAYADSERQNENSG